METLRQYTLKELRARKDVTQKQAAQDLGISVQTYNAWENDLTNVKIGKVLKVAEYYGVQLNEIFLQRHMNRIQARSEEAAGCQKAM